MAATALFNSFTDEGTHFGLGWPVVAETLLPVLGRRSHVLLLLLLFVVAAVQSPSFSEETKISAGMVDDEAVVDDRRTFLSHFILFYE